MNDLALAFCESALSNVEAMNPAERADFFEFAAGVLARAKYTTEAAAAHGAARALREEEARQLIFRAVMDAANAPALRVVETLGGSKPRQSRDCMSRARTRNARRG